MIDIAEAHSGLSAIDRHDHFYFGQLAQRGDFFQCDHAFGGARVGCLAVEVDDVGAKRRHLRHDLAFAAFADRQHDHHRCHADNDAQQRQRSPEAVDPHDPPRRLNGVEQFAFPGPMTATAFAQTLAQVDGL